MLTKKELENYLDIAKEAATAGGYFLSKFWGKAFKIQEKETPGDLVTEADKYSEKAIIEILTSRCPSHSLLAEESGRKDTTQSEFLWTVDPLDGTINYAHGFPFVAVSIALLYQGYPVVGVIYNPILQELFTCTRGGGAFLGNLRLYVSKTNQLGKSLLATGFPYNRRGTADNNYKEFAHLTNLTQGVRRAGAAALDLAYVASGQFDGYWEKGIKPWDIAAGALLVEEAGGKVSAYDGSALDIMEPQILATNGHIHQSMIQELSILRQTI
ncbi:MAG: suhB-A [Chlamydiales bacterium]|jgi:myo-inositol-1(or 4)-monophosphatase|nr:suhB-A [Chlamydiales bacterium]